MFIGKIKKYCLEASYYKESSDLKKNGFFHFHIFMPPYRVKVGGGSSVPRNRGNQAPLSVILSTVKWSPQIPDSRKEKGENRIYPMSCSINPEVLRITFALISFPGTQSHCHLFTTKNDESLALCPGRIIFVWVDRQQLPLRQGK